MQLKEERSSLSLIFQVCCLHFGRIFLWACFLEAFVGERRFSLHHFVIHTPPLISRNLLHQATARLAMVRAVCPLMFSSSVHEPVLEVDLPSGFHLLPYSCTRSSARACLSMSAPLLAIALLPMAGALPLGNVGPWSVGLCLYRAWQTTQGDVVDSVLKRLRPVN